MSKERLEEIEKQLNRSEKKRNNLDIQEFQNILEQQLINGNLNWLIKYAKEQAECAQDLNYWKKVAKWQNDEKIKIDKGYLRMERQNKRYREAMEKAFYKLYGAGRLQIEGFEAMEILDEALERE